MILQQHCLRLLWCTDAALLCYLSLDITRHTAEAPESATPARSTEEESVAALEVHTQLHIYLYDSLPVS
jgi:hypothetical protein